MTNDETMTKAVSRAAVLLIHRGLAGARAYRRIFSAFGLRHSFVIRASSFVIPLLLTLSAAASPQNILLLIADDYGADSSSLYNTTASGASLPPTPNIASLATNGVVFSRANSYPVCSPTRACLLTGQFGFRRRSRSSASGILPTA
jgi:hypothetical protein